MSSIPPSGSYGSSIADGTDESVSRAQQRLQQTTNMNSVYQMNMMERQSQAQLHQTKISMNTELMNAAKQTAEKIRL